jgi:hypothetical protein
LHSTVSNSNVAVIDEWLADLTAAVDEIGGARAADRSATYATLE